MAAISDTIIDRARAVKVEAEKIDTSRTEVVRMADLRVGDVVLAVGPDAKAFPFPFTLSTVRVLRGVVVLTATHGWFNLRPYPESDPAIIVARVS